MSESRDGWFVDGRRLNVYTARYRESAPNGLMICGINWGGQPGEGASTSADASYFSDPQAIGGEPYATRIVTWFRLLGHPLQATEPGAFERSIVQTNWLDTVSPSMRGKDVQRECIAGWADFERHLAILRPRLVLFMSIQLLHALNSPECLPRASALLGQAGRLVTWQKDVSRPAGGRYRRFKIGAQCIGTTQFIAFPHPSGSVGVADEYIAAFKEDLAPHFEEFKRSLVPSPPPVRPPCTLAACPPSSPSADPTPSSPISTPARSPSVSSPLLPSSTPTRR